MIRPLLFSEGEALVPVKLPPRLALESLPHRVLFNERAWVVYAVIDAADAHLVDDRAWFAKVRNHTIYAHDRAGEPLHCRLFPMADEVDHADHDGLNCRRANLRPLTGSKTRLLQNANTRPHRDGRVTHEGRRLKGVRIDGDRYEARITTPHGKRKSLGRFDRASDAGRAYDEAVRRFYPGGAVFLNFPEEERVR